MSTPKTLIEAITFYSDPDVCHEMMLKVKWPNDKITCPHCGGDKIGHIRSRRMLQCKSKKCRKQFSTKVGTIFEDSPIPLQKWFVAVWCIANCKNGISSYELARHLGVTQKSAWFMLHRIRCAMEAGGFDKFDGPAEADATYVGGKAANMHKAKREKKITGRGTVGKTIVHGVLQRSTADKPSEVRASVVKRDDATTVLGEIRRHVRYRAEVYTDEAKSYGEIALTHFHKWIDHSVEYARGNVHTNGMENFWSLLKRSINGTYVAVSPWHLQRYVAEQTWRFNNRNTDDGFRFQRVLAAVVGKRLTYRVLCATDDAGFMGIE